MKYNKLVRINKNQEAMKKLISFLCLLLASAAWVSAQNVVTGTVTDRDGNPIPGAKVSIVESTESVITELDGTFRIETEQTVREVQVVYAGMQGKVQAYKPGMVVKLAKTTWWNTEPEKYSWLISVQGAFPESGVKNPSFGLMVGRVKTLGWYVKGVYAPSESTDCDYDRPYWTTGEDKRSFYAATAGALVRLGCPVHAYVGAGYAKRSVAWELADGAYADYSSDFMDDASGSYSGVALDYGLMLRFGKFSVNGGVIMSLADGCNFIGNFGIGVCF